MSWKSPEDSVGAIWARATSSTSLVVMWGVTIKLRNVWDKEEKTSSNTFTVVLAY